MDRRLVRTAAGWRRRDYWGGVNVWQRCNRAATLLSASSGPKLGGTSVAPRLRETIMTKVFVYSTALAAGLILPSAAAAQSPPSSCPPGSWFCVQPPDAQAAPPGGAV